MVKMITVRAGKIDGSAVKHTDWLLFQRTRVQFPAITWLLTTIYNSDTVTQTYM